MKPKKLATPSSLAALLATASAASAATVISYPDFSDVTGLQLNGDAAQVGSVLRVTPSSAGQAGSVFSTDSIALNSEVSFSTAFSFQISAPGGISDGDGVGADGLVFVVQTNSNSVGSSGGGIGYLGVPNSLGIEFDTWDNGSSFGDPNGNHISINTGGALSPTLGTATVADRMNDGDVLYAWVDYDGPSDDLEVRFSSSSARPALPFLEATVDLTGVLGSPNAFVGFTSGTGSAYGDHDILSWEFRDDFEPIDPDPPTGVPDGGSTLLMFLAGIIGLKSLGRHLSPRRRASE